MSQQKNTAWAEVSADTQDARCTQISESPPTTLENPISPFEQTHDPIPPFEKGGLGGIHQNKHPATKDKS